MAPTYARALGRSPIAPDLPGLYAPPVADNLSADLHAFLDARPTDEQRLWEHLLIDRQALVDELAAYPQTLLHNDLDDRNIGLRGPDRQDGARASALVLIDWEWLARGPAALDVAEIVARAPVMLTPGAKAPAALWNNTLVDAYWTHYRAAGGRCLDAAAWRRSFGVALVARSLSQMPAIHGALRRAIRGDVPPPPIVGVSAMERMEARVIREARRWLS